MRADRTEITIGDRVNLAVTVTADTILTVTLPATEDALGVFEVKEFRREEPRVDQSGRRVYRWEFQLTTWTTGQWIIPPLTVAYTDPAGQVGSASSDSLVITVKSILEAAGADTVDIHDLKPPYQVPASHSAYYYIASAVALGALAVWFFLRRRRPGDLAAGDTRAPWERAFDDLRELRASAFLSEGRWREWYFALTEIFRRYLDRRYGAETLEATTTEVKAALTHLPVTEAERREIISLLEFADLVKFARLVPPSERPESDLDWVWAFVERTRMEDVSPAAPMAEKTGTSG